MDASDIRNLQEAYLEVYSSPDFLKESKPQFYWTDASLKGANKDPNDIDPEHEKRRIEFNKRIRQSSRGKGSAAERRAIGRGLIPDTRNKIKEDLEFILDYLLDEGYANTLESAEAILENMSEGWIESICEAIADNELSGQRKKQIRNERKFGTNSLYSKSKATKERHKLHKKKRGVSRIKGDKSGEKDASILAQSARVHRSKNNGYNKDGSYIDK